MFFRSNNYTVTDYTKDMFTQLYSGEDPIKNVTFADESIFFSVENAIFKYGSKKTKKVNRFDDKVSVLYGNGNLLFGGDIRGNIKVIGKNRIVLRSYNEHQDKINALKLYNNDTLVSCSNDASIKMFNIIKEKSFHTFSDFDDHVTSIKIENDVLFTGTSDCYIHSYCLRENSRNFRIKVNSPVKYLDKDSGNHIIFTSKNKVYRFDLRNPQRTELLLAHNKEITGLQIFENKIYSISLDGHLKKSTGDGKLMSQINLKAPILDFEITEEAVYFGLESGSLSVIESNKKDQKKEENYDESSKRRKIYEKQIEHQVVLSTLRKSNKIEKLLDKFEHKGALIKCLDNKDKSDVFSVLHYLQKNKTLKGALLFLDLKYVTELFDFIIDNFFVVEFYQTFYETIILLTSIYYQEIQNDDVLFEKIQILSEIVDEEAYFQEKIIEMIGFFECYETMEN